MFIDVHLCKICCSHVISLIGDISLVQNADDEVNYTVTRLYLSLSLAYTKTVFSDLLV